MTGPGGSQTKRDQRRDSRRGQFQQRQRERQRERQRKIRQRRTIRFASIGATVVVVALFAFLLIHTASGGGATSNTPVPGSGAHKQYTTPATGEDRAGMTCYGQEQFQQHIHAYLAIYEDGKQVTVPGGVGIPGQCIYPLHVHQGEPNIIHVEAPNQDTYTLGQFFAIWGMPLSATQVGDKTSDASHPLTFVTIDANGNQQTWTGDPQNIPVKAHETVVILYNSPDVHPQPYTNWGDL